MTMKKLTGYSMGKKDKTAPERVARDRAKKLKAGFVRVNVWVPSDDRDMLVYYAETLRKNVQN